MRVAAGVKFDDGGAEAHRGLDLARVGFDEQADADARVVEAGDDGGEMIVLPRGVEPALGRALLALFGNDARSEEHTSELQSLMRISSAVFCLQKKNKHKGVQ